MSRAGPQQPGGAPGPSGVRVELAGVRRAFAEGPGGRPRVALERIDLTLAAGDFVALVGPSGCGKSTLLRLVAGLDEPTEGRVHVDDTPCSDAVVSSIAYVFQDATLMPWRTVAANVSLPLEIAKRGRIERAAAAERALRAVGLPEEARLYPKQLSGGMRMRASLARALVSEPRLLLMDEPFAAVDEITRQALDQQLRELWERTPMTLMFVTHSVAEAVFLARRVLVLSPRPGRIVADLELGLPAQRGPELRTSTRYASEMARVQSALIEGASTP